MLCAYFYNYNCNFYGSLAKSCVVYIRFLNAVEEFVYCTNFVLFRTLFRTFFLIKKYQKLTALKRLRSATFKQA
jgi:hypothetical protein